MKDPLNPSASICLLCIANPARECDCQNPKPLISYKEKPKLVDELNDLKFTGTWDIYYTGMDKQQNPPRCLVRGDGVLVYATFIEKKDAYSRWCVGRAKHSADIPSCIRYFATAKEAMGWVDQNIIERRG